MIMRNVLITNLAIILAIILIPALSITGANFIVETGLLTKVGGQNIITFGFSRSLGLAWPNLITISGILIIIDTAIIAITKVRSLQADDEKAG